MAEGGSKCNAYAKCGDSVKNEKDLNLENKEDNEMVKVKVRIWIDPYIKADEHGRRVRVRGHWKLVEVESGKPIRFPYKEKELFRNRKR